MNSIIPLPPPAPLPQRPRDSHKGRYGTVLVIGGATGMVGAALLAGRAALKLGAGCVHVALLADPTPLVDWMQPELMLHNARQPLPQASVGVIGCGMGTDDAASTLLGAVLQSPLPLVLDADALNLLARNAELQQRLATRTAPSLLTPHPGEAARLLHCSPSEIQKNRHAAALKLAQNYRCSVVLKGANSLIATRDGALFVNPTGNPGMSAPGMGDVLSGMIAALIAQGLEADEALRRAVYLHGAAGDELARAGIAIGMTASELIDAARRLINQ